MRFVLAFFVAALIGIHVLPAHAGYAQLVPPPGITSVGNVTTVAVGTASNGARYAGGHVIANASLQVGARAVVVPVGYRVAANAAVFAVTKLNPYVAGLSLLAAAVPFVVDWLSGSGDELVYDPISGKIQQKTGGSSPPPFTGSIEDQGVDLNELLDTRTGLKFPSVVSSKLNSPSEWTSCGNIDVVRISAFTIENGCGPGNGEKYVTVCQAARGWSGSICVGGGPLPMKVPPTYSNPTPAQISALGSVPVDPRIFPALNEPMPIEGDPVINPSNIPTGDVKIGPDGNPAPQLQPSTLRVPDGAPVPVPNTSPQQYTQPWLEIVPAPTPEQPLRVDIRPVTTTTTSPTAPTDPVTNPSTPSTPNPSSDPCRANPESLMCQPPGNITDPDMPPIPELYTRKYPDGIVGIWQTKTAALTQTSLVTVLGQMMPTGITGGTCPTWTLNLSFGPDWADMGTHEVAPPCWLWDVAKAIMIISALMLARQLIFGG